MSSRSKFRPSWLTTRGAAPKKIDPIVDEFFDSYLRWREACEDLRTAYDLWHRCEPAQRVLAFCGYRAALDREEREAHVHSQLAERFSASTG